MLEGRSKDNLNFWVWGGNDNINKKCEGKKGSSLKDTFSYLLRYSIKMYNVKGVRSGSHRPKFASKFCPIISWVNLSTFFNLSKVVLFDIDNGDQWDSYLWGSELTTMYCLSSFWVHVRHLVTTEIVCVPRTHNILLLF